MARAPGYNSWAWTQQDWRTVQLHADGSWSYDRKCGDGSTLPSGRKRLCLPRSVLDTLARSQEGRRIVREQAKKKQGAEPGTRVQWHPKIRALVNALDQRTPADRRRNPAMAYKHFSERDVDEFADGYWGAMSEDAVFAGENVEGQELMPDDFDPEDMERVNTDIARFLAFVDSRPFLAAVVAPNLREAGIGFYLVRNGYGGAFRASTFGRRESQDLRSHADTYGHQYAYTGDDGLFYLE